MDMATYSTIGADEADKALLHNKPKTSFKAIVAGDLEESVQLGLLDISEEEAALCSCLTFGIHGGFFVRQCLSLRPRVAGGLDRVNSNLRALRLRSGG